MIKVVKFIAAMASLLSTCLLLSLLVATVPQADGRHVSMDVKAPWPRYAGSFAAEVSEFLSEESDELFWKYVEAMCEHTAEYERLEASNDEDSSIIGSNMQALAFEAATSILPKSLHPFMNTVIGLNTYAPAVQFFNDLAANYGEPCGNKAFIVSYPGGKIHCDYPSFEHDGGSMAPVGPMDASYYSSTSEEWDHIYRGESDNEAFSDSNTGRKHAVLYGTLGSTSFCTLHHNLQVHVDTRGSEGNLAYSVRHAFPGQATVANSTRLQGYGVWLDIKNMEYKNVDDKFEGDGADTQATSSESEEEMPKDDEEVAGVTLSTLLEAHKGLNIPEDVVNSWRLGLRDAQLASDVQALGDDDGSTKLWKMKDLGLQATHSIMTSQDKASRFRDVVHNFPTAARALSGIKAKQFRRTEEAVTTWFNSGKARSVPVNSMFVNGLHIDLSGATFNVYDVFSNLRGEYYQIEKLKQLALNKDEEEKVQSLVMHLASESGNTGGGGGAPGASADDGGKVMRIDVSRGARHVITFANNLERDPQYAQWPRKLVTLTQPTWSLHSLRRNVYTMIANLDVLSENGAIIMYQLNSMLQQSYPIRFGVVPVCDIDAALAPYRSTDIDGPEKDELASLRAYFGDRDLTSAATKMDVCLLFSALRQKEKGKEKKGKSSTGPEVAFDFLNNIAVHVVTKIQEKGESINSGSADGEKSDDDSYLAVTISSLIELYASTMSRNSEFSMTGALVGKDTSRYAEDGHRLVLGRSRDAKAGANPSGAVLSSIEAPELAEALESHTQFARNVTVYLSARNLPENSYSINGIVKSDVDMNQVMMGVLGKEQYLLSQLVQTRKIPEKTKSVFSAILSVTGAYPRYHPLLEETDQRYVDMSLAAIRQLMSPSASYSASSPYLYNEAGAQGEAGDDLGASSTLVACPVTASGLHTAKQALRWIIGDKDEADAAPSDAANGAGGSDEQNDEEADKHRLKIVFYVSSSFARGSDDKAHELERAATEVSSVLASRSSDKEKALLAMQTIDAALLHTHVASEADSSTDGGRHSVEPFLANFRLLQQGGVFPKSSSKEQGSPAFVLHNSRLLFIGTPPDSQSPEIHGDSSGPLNPLDLDLLSTVEKARVRTPLLSALGWTEISADKLLFLTSYVGMASSGSGDGGSGASKRFDVDSLLSEVRTSNEDLEEDLALIKSHLMFSVDCLDGNSDSVSATGGGIGNKCGSSGSDIEILYYVDPLSTAGQRAAGLVEMLSEQLQIRQTVLLLPRLEVGGNEFPLQNYYRYVLSPHDHDNAVGYFRNLPKQHTLTLRPDAPESWNLQAVSASQDPDNLRCDKATAGSSGSANSPCGDKHPQTGAVTSTTTLGLKLQNLLVSGQCFERTKESEMGFAYPQPPNGLQLILRGIDGAAAETNGTLPTSTYQSDTLVMQNLGYFQLQASPGLYSLHLARGRASELFTIDAAEYDEEIEKTLSSVDPACEVSDQGACLPPSSGDGDEVDAAASVGDTNKGLVVAVRSFASSSSSTKGRLSHVSGMSLTLSVAKRKGKEDEPLLEPNEGDDERMMTKRQARYKGGSRKGKGKGKSTRSNKKADKKGKKKNAGFLSSIFGSSGDVDTEKARALQHVDDDSDDTIHVFSLATGHMYERLLRIMMLSVTKRSSRKIHFWLFENYLSPTFKSIAQAMAGTFGFKVSYVTYKWPAWLTQQTQKQRIIWGYKILFLDVLFPLWVKKVIYVDADQVVRADLAELWDMDLHGKPYAYTPFCTSREETLGFQFWRSGYWADHLQGSPYHISALYVVDLDNFRRNAVGDELRAVYDSLARDPNSLANLDQDLPNYAQHSVPIHSLPQEWLWCETWCSDDSKLEAKTIDLCNNPLHKEPKLDMARRVISGALFNESWIELDEEVAKVEASLAL